MYFNSVLFDLDDTIHDRSKSLCKFIELFMQKFSQRLNNKSQLVFKDIFFEIDNKGYKPREEMFRELLRKTSWNEEPNLNELIQFWNNEFPKCAEPMTNLYKVLDYFMNKNIKLGIITNGETKFQNSKIDKLDLRKYMKTIIISEEVNVRKPDSRIFELALSEINSSYQTCLFVGDNPLLDIKGANDAGLISIWLKNGQEWSTNEYYPRYIINNLSELMLI